MRLLRGYGTRPRATGNRKNTHRQVGAARASPLAFSLWKKLLAVRISVLLQIWREMNLRHSHIYLLVFLWRKKTHCDKSLSHWRGTFKWAIPSRVSVIKGIVAGWQDWTCPNSVQDSTILILECQRRSVKRLYMLLQTLLNRTNNLTFISIVNVWKNRRRIWATNTKITTRLMTKRCAACTHISPDARQRSLNDGVCEKDWCYSWLMLL